MARPIDYSQWDHIEISDDEDDTHPNIDTPSLFRWRHQARVEREETATKEKGEFERNYNDHQRKMLEMKKKLKDADAENLGTDELSKLKLEVSVMEKQEEEWHKKEEELKQKEKNTAWNVDSICHDGKSKTIINKDKPQETEALTDEEKLEKQSTFQDKYENEMKKFGMFKRYEDSETYLSEHTHLVCEETANYLVYWCINLELMDKHDLMHHVSHQTIVMQFILELAKTLKCDPRQCIKPFFARFSSAEKSYMDAFNDELDSFRERIKARAAAKLESAMREQEEEDRQQRLGPGGLDPIEVMETLPKALQDCFESKDIEMLKRVITELPEEEASLHLKRCVDSGLWVPEASTMPGEDESQTDEEKYATVGETVDETPVDKDQ